MTIEEIQERTQDVCARLNALIPCRSQDDIDKMTAIFTEYFDLPIQPKPMIYWDQKVFYDCGFNKDRCTDLLLRTDSLRFDPSDDVEEHPGVVVKYKQP